MRPTFRYGAAILAIALVTIGGLSLLRRGHRSIRLGGTSLPASRGHSAPANLAALDSSMRALEDGARNAPRDRWDPEYVVAQVGRDPSTLFHWVQENTRWVPYRGLLRGATGVLMDRQGNSLDRAVLLGTLLSRAGHTVRLAHGELGRERALELLPLLVTNRLAPVVPDADSVAGSNTEVRTVAATYHLDGAAIERTLDAQETAIKRLTTTLDDHVSDQTTRLLAAVERPDPSVEWKQRFDSALTALQDHWWVQRQDGAAWVDVDVLASPDSTGQPLVPARETMAMGDVPALLHHEIVVRVVAERWNGSKPSEERVLEDTLRPSELIGQPVVLQFWPGDWPSQEILATADRMKTFRQAALQQERWSVALGAGATTTRAMLLESGKIESGGGGGLGGLGRGIGQGLQNRNGAADSPNRSALTAVWLEYELLAPGAASRTMRRTVFDLLGPTARAAKRPPAALSDAQRLSRSLALMMRTEILPLPTRFAPEFVRSLTTQSLVANRRLLHAAAAGQIDPGATDSLFAPSAPPVGPLSALALARFELSPVGDEIYVGHAGLLTRHQGPEPAGDGIAMIDAIDIVANDVDVDLMVPDAFPVRVAQGVFETNAEAMLPVVREPVENAGVAYTGSQKWVTLKPGRGDEVAGLQLPEDVRTRIRGELEAGFVVIAPRALAMLGRRGYATWWRIDPATGSTLGMGDRGWGQMVDRAMLTDLAAYMAENFAFEYGLCQAIPQIENDLHFVGNVLQERGWAPSWTKPAPDAVDPVELAKANERVCVIQAIKMGFVATLPLVLLTIRYSSAGRVVWNPALRRFVYNEIGGVRIPPKLVKGPVGGGPGSPHGSPTLPSMHVPEGAGTNPKGYPNPLAEGTGPQANPLAKTQPDLSHTQFDPAARPEPPTPVSEPGPPLTPEQARDNLRNAQAAYEAAAQESFEATKDYVQYRQNKPNPGRGWAGDPANWDPTVDEALQNDMSQKQQATIEQINNLKNAQKAARDASARARGAAGAGGFPQPQQAPQPQPALVGCPPNCGNENLTVPKIQVQPSGSSAAGQIEVGSAGVANSFWEFPWPK